MILTPDMVQDLKICIGDFHKTYRSGGIRFDEQTQQWWIHPSQEETLAMPACQTMICAHVKYHDEAVYILELGRANITPRCCGEVF